MPSLTEFSIWPEGRASTTEVIYNDSLCAVGVDGKASGTRARNQRDAILTAHGFPVIHKGYPWPLSLAWGEICRGARHWRGRKQGVWAGH